MLDQAPALEGKLAAARDAWLSGFWKSSGLAPSKKADGDGSDSDAELTADEAVALRKIVAALSGDGYAQALYDEMAIAVEAGWLSGGELLKMSAEVDTSFGTVPAETLDAIRQRTDALAFLVNEREQTQLYDLITAAVANGQTVDSLTQSIQDSFANGYHVIDKDSGAVVRVDPPESWAQIVARTELSRAQTMGQVAVYQDAGIERVMWQTNHGGTVCDECEEADGEVVALGDVFEGVDTDFPPAHPSCCCSLLPADDDVRFDQNEAA